MAPSPSMDVAARLLANAATGEQPHARPFEKEQSNELLALGRHEKHKLKCRLEQALRS
jgi:hypothetical protein